MKGICAIIITLNPDKNIIRNVSILTKQVDKILVIDNASHKTANALFTIIDNANKVKCIFNKENIGLAAGLNIGVMYALRNNFKWVVLFDQDSIVNENYINSLLNTYDAVDDSDRVVVIAPRYQDLTTGKIQSFSKKAYKKYSSITTTNTSGSLIKVDIFNKIGLFRSDFFIDYIDKEFCLRCMINGYKIIESYNTMLLHNVGKPKLFSLLWKTPISSNHLPMRRYYMTRNRMVIYKTYFIYKPFWVFEDMGLLMKEVIKILLYEKDVLYKYCCMLRGLWHGIIGRMGPLPAIPAR